MTVQKFFCGTIQYVREALEGLGEECTIIPESLRLSGNSRDGGLVALILQKIEEDPEDLDNNGEPYA